MILQLIVSSCEIVSSIVFVIHYNPQLITGQLGSWKESAAKHMKEHCLPLESSLNVRYLSKILNFTTDMTNEWVT